MDVVAHVLVCIVAFLVIWVLVASLNDYLTRDKGGSPSERTTKEEVSMEKYEVRELHGTTLGFTSMPESIVKELEELRAFKAQHGSKMGPAEAQALREQGKTERKEEARRRYLPKILDLIAIRAKEGHSYLSVSEEEQLEIFGTRHAGQVCAIITDLLIEEYGFYRALVRPYIYRDSTINICSWDHRDAPIMLPLKETEELPPVWKKICSGTVDEEVLNLKFPNKGVKKHAKNKKRKSCKV